jgi:uncharacterized repeat protein (TIGR01451 family)
MVTGYWSYRMLGPIGTTYTFTLLGTPAGYVLSCPTNGVLTHTVTYGVPANALNFGFICSSIPVFDLGIYMSPTLRANGVPMPSSIYIHAFNSTCPPTAATLTLHVSPKYTINTTGILPTPASVTGQKIVWNLSGMANNSYAGFHVPVTPLSTTLVGDTACNSAVITPITGDVNPANNTRSSCDSVRGAWDPNEKSVTPAVANAGATLTYTVQFENLGNDTAYNIHVQDTLSSSLDANTLKVLSSTHMMGTSFHTAPNGRTVVKFDFPNIKLEDKNHPLKNKGTFTFTIKTKTGIPLGTDIANRAGIYFDGNPVVLTNNAWHRIGQPSTGVTLLRGEDVRIFPNPAGSAMTVQIGAEGYDAAIVRNALGQVVLRAPLHAGSNTLNVQALPAGIYSLQATGSAGSSTVKFEKQ